jgi:hypothetical protein
MRKLLLILCFALAPAFAAAQDVDRDILLTPGGTLFTVQSGTPAEFELEGTSSFRVLRLTIRNGAEKVVQYVPASPAGGRHQGASLAWDDETKSLFVFWQKKPHPLFSELLLSSYRDGVWSEPTPIDDTSYRVRQHLNIALTRQPVELEEPEEGQEPAEPQSVLLVHAVWWDSSSTSELARYAIIHLDQGEARAIRTFDLIDWTADEGAPTILDEDFDREFFKFPSIFTNGMTPDVEVVFGDWIRNRLQRVKLRPVVAGGVLELPIGVWEGPIEPPSKFNRNGDGAISAIGGLSADNFAFYYREEGTIRYIFRRNGEWSGVLSLGIGDELSADGGVEVLRRMLTMR